MALEVYNYCIVGPKGAQIVGSTHLEEIIRAAEIKNEQCVAIVKTVRGAFFWRHLAMDPADEQIRFSKESGPFLSFDGALNHAQQLFYGEQPRRREAIEATKRKRDAHIMEK